MYRLLSCDLRMKSSVTFLRLLTWGMSWGKKGEMKDCVCGSLILWRLKNPFPSLRDRFVSFWVLLCNPFTSSSFPAQVCLSLFLWEYHVFRFLSCLRCLRESSFLSFSFEFFSGFLRESISPGIVCFEEKKRNKKNTRPERDRKWRRRINEKGVLFIERDQETWFLFSSSSFWSRFLVFFEEFRCVYVVVFFLCVILMCSIKRHSLRWWSPWYQMAVRKLQRIWWCFLSLNFVFLFAFRLKRSWQRLKTLVLLVINPSGRHWTLELS